MNVSINTYFKWFKFCCLIQLFLPPFGLISTIVYVINRKFIQICLINLLTFNFFIVALIITCFFLLISMCSVLLPPSKRTKLTTQSIWCAFLRYGDGQKDFVCYDPQPKQLRISINVTILDKIPFFRAPNSSSSPIPSPSFMPLFSNSSTNLSSISTDFVSIPPSINQFKGAVYQQQKKNSQLPPHDPLPKASTAMHRDPPLDNSIMPLQRSSRTISLLTAMDTFLHH